MAAQPSPLQIPLINGVRHEFASIEMNLAGIIFRGFKSIDYSRTRERGWGHGNSADPIFKTRGKNTYKCSVEVYLAEWNYLMTSLGPGYGDIFFPIYASYGENGLDPIQDIITGCTIDMVEASQSDSVDALVRKIEFNPLKIYYNGIDDMGVPLTAPPQ